jgi:hypothetical protein
MEITIITVETRSRTVETVEVPVSSIRGGETIALGDNLAEVHVAFASNDYKGLRCIGFTKGDWSGHDLVYMKPTDTVRVVR